MKINKKVLGVKESATLAINQLALAKKGQGNDVYHFGFGQSPFPVISSLEKGLQKHAWRKNYLPGLGSDELKQAIADYYVKNFSLNLDAKNVVIGPGSKELIFDILFCLKGELILPSPCWVSYAPQAGLVNKKVHSIACQFENGYKLKADELEKTAQKIKKQKLLILNSPSNPTGQSYSESELKDLADVINRYEIITISDEIYAEVYWESNAKYSSHPRAPSLEKYAPNYTIITSGLSKAYNAGGYRLGFSHIPNPELIKSLASLISEVFSCVSSPTQYAAIEMFNDKNTLKEVKRNNQILKYGFELLTKPMQDADLCFHPASGGFYLYLDFSLHKKQLAKKNITTSSQLCKRLIDDVGVVFLPSVEFGRKESEFAVRAAVVDFDGASAVEAFKRTGKIESVNTHFTKMLDGIQRVKNWLSS